MRIHETLVIQSLRKRDLKAVRAILHDHPEAARSARPIGEAGRLAWKEALALLLRHGADPNALSRGYRPLHALIQEAPHARHGRPAPARIACLGWLVRQGANPDLPAAWPPARALLTAAFVGQPSYVDALREAGATMNGFVLCALGDLARIKRLLRKDPAFATARDDGGLTALQCCAGSRMGADDPEVARSLARVAATLLDHGADLTATTRGWDHDLDAVYFAVGAGNREIFELLLERGASPTAALPAAAWKDVTFAEAARRHGAILDQALDGQRPLLSNLVRWGQIRPALWLLAHGVNPNLTDARGWTSVHQAASRGNERMLKAILAAGGDPSRAAADGLLPIDIARASGRAKIVALL